MIEVTVRGPDGRLFGGIEIHCVEANGRQPDSVNVYEATIRYLPACQPNAPMRTRHVTVEHRYGDPWPVLVREAIEAMEVMP